MFVGVGVRQFTDTTGYVQMSSLSVWDADFFWSGHCPLVVPLFYKLLRADPTAVTIFHLVLSVICWSVLAIVVVKVVRTRWLRPVALVSVLGLSLSAEIIQWDRVMLSESISLSLMALFVACWLWLFKDWHWHRYALLVFVAFLWVFARDINAYTVLMLGASLLPFIILKWVLKRYLVVTAALVIIFILSNASMNAGKRWVDPFLNVLFHRILPYSDQLSYFVELGMPVSPALMGRISKSAHSNGGTLFRDPALKEFRAWLYARGKQSYMRYLISHHNIRINEPLTYLRSLFHPRISHYAPENFSPPLGVWFTILSHRQIWLYRLWLSGLVLGTIGIVVLKQSRTCLILPILLLAISLPLAIIVWHGDAMELARHVFPVGVQLRLGLCILLLFLVDGTFVELRCRLSPDTEQQEVSAQEE